MIGFILVIVFLLSVAGYIFSITILTDSKVDRIFGSLKYLAVWFFMVICFASALISAAVFVQDIMPRL